MKNKKIIIPIIIALLAVGAGTFYWQNHKSAKSPSIQNTGPSPEQKKQEDKANADKKGEVINDKTTPTPSNPQNTTPSPQPSASSISLTAKQEANGTVTVLTNLGSVSNGTCTLDVTNNGKTSSQTAAVIYQTQYSSCAGFSVPVSSVGAGNWNIKLTVTQGATSLSSSITKEVT